MGHLRNLACISAAIIPLFLLLPKETHPYLDPGTGSLIIQILIGVVAGGLVAIRIFWNKIKTASKRLFQRGKKQDGTKR